MKIVIGGAGKVGSLILKELAAEQHELILIEQDADVLENNIAQADISGLVGSVTSIEDLQEAGVADADFFIAVTENDETNIIAAIMADRMGAVQSLARVRNPQYSSQMTFIRDSLGINQIINPELEAARDIAKILKYPAAKSVDSFFGGRALVIELRLPDKSKLHGLKLVDFRKRHPEILIGTISRNDEVIIPRGHAEIRSGDRLLILGTIRPLDRLYQDLGLKQSPQRNALAVGGGKITHYLLKMLQGSGTNFTVIERDRKIAEELAANFSEHRIIVGDGTDYNVLEEQKIEGCDIFLAMTGIDEENILTSLYAKQRGVPRYFTKVNRTAILKIIGSDALQAVITPKRIIADRVLRLVRATQNSEGSNVEALFRLLDNEVEALEFIVKDDAKILDTPLASLKIKEDCLVALISRGREIIMPSGKASIQAGDHIVVMSKKSQLEDVDDILED
ncbi:MAG: Trk system potassium transporter TrkA [Eubacteriales bacterium]|nr:Trk system potassium transporter TrkA [Eubacteriales bacterium]